MQQGIIDLLLGPAGTLVLALTIIFTGVRKKWVFGWQYEESQKREKEWKEMALRGTELAEKAVKIHNKDDE